MSLEVNSDGSISIYGVDSAPVVHQNQGGGTENWGPTSPVPHLLLRSDGNIPLAGDLIQWISRDASLLVNLTVTVPNAGDSVGVDWTVSGTQYSPRYTVQAGDTANAVALGIGNAILASTALMTALAAYSPAASGNFKSDGFGYQPYQTGVANQTTGGVTTFDQPYGTTLATFSSGTTTLAITGNDGNATPGLDAGPSLIIQRQVPGYTPRANDRGGQIIFQGASGSANTGVGLAAIKVRYTAPGTTVLDFNSGTAVMTLPNHSGNILVDGALAATQSTPSNPTGIASVAGLMAGLAGTITPTQTGRVRFTITGSVANNTNTGSTIVGRYGTGTAPSNGGALAGTRFGNINGVSFNNTVVYPVTLNGIVTGLTLGTAYWIDVALSSTSGTVSLFNPCIIAQEF